MPPVKRQGTREQELRTAIVVASGLTTTDRWVFTVLLTDADWSTAHLPDRFQPRSLIKLAEKCHVSARQVKYSIGHLQRHGWLERHRNITEEGTGGRGHPTRYVLLAGRDCDCKEGTECTVPARKRGSECTGKGAQAVPVAAGQPRDSAGEAVMREGGRGEYLGGPVEWESGWPADSHGAEMNP